MHPDLQLALALADLADAVALPRFRARDLQVEAKPDRTPVTDADRAVEHALRERLAWERPADAVLGEEEGQAGAAGRRWVVDPIDGTRNFSRGIPVWFTLVALEEDGEPVVGVASAPALGRRWWAARGEGAWADGARLRVSRVGRIEDAVVSVASSGHAEAGGLVGRAWHLQQFSDAWGHVLVAEGAVDAAADHVVERWDVAALRVIVEEAGGRATDLSGAARSDGGSLLSTNGLLHEELLRVLASRRR